MIRTLQKRFVFSAMLAVTVLLAFLLGAINISHSVITNRQIDRILDTLTESRGTYSPPEQRTMPRRAFRAAPTPDDVMGARYFLVVLNEAGEAVHTNVKHIYAVSEESAETMAKEVFASLESEGRREQFEFRVSDMQGRQGKLAVFLDVSSRRSAIRSVLQTSCGIGLLCWLVMLLLVTVISRRAIAPIAENIEKQKQFVTNAGHEIKTPLAIILANIDAMELISGENKWSRNIRAQANRLSGLMQNLLTLAKMDEESKLSVNEFSMSLLLGEAIELYGEAAEGRQLTLHTHVEENVTLRANRESILQLVSALLDNAVKYTAEGGEVSVTLAKTEGKVRLRVENDCPAPPTAELSRLFDRFYRGDEARTQSEGGYGIGLSAARAIAEAHHGKIGASYDAENERIAFSVIL